MKLKGSSVTIWFALVVATAACEPNTPPTAGHDREHDREHDHEPRHDELPRTVALSEGVVDEAGITTAAVATRSLRPTVRLHGEIVANPNLEATVAARIDGIIESIGVQPGDLVKRGEVIATVRAPDLQSLRAAVAADEAKAVAARQNAQRLAALVDKQLASRQEAVAAEAEANAIEAQARAARGKLRALGLGRSGRAVTFDVRAPLDGVVIQRPVSAGSPVTPETVVATLVDPSEVWFEAHVFERDIERVQTGAAASVQLHAYPEARFEGVVDYVSHRVDPGARTLSARIPLANPDDRLRLGLFGTAHVVVTGEANEPVLAVPNSAITTINDEPVVFVRQDDGHFELHEVVLGASDPSHTEVVHGLREGETVVSEGVFTVKGALLRDTLGEGHH